MAQDLGSSRIRLEQTQSIPEESWELPRDEAYFLLGCIGCTKSVFFTASNYTSEAAEFSLDPDGTTDLLDIVEETPFSRIFGGFRTSIYEPECSDACAKGDEITTVVDMLNERFSAELKLEG